MKTKLFTMIAAVGALATLATGCDKPDNTPACLIGRGLWVATYTKVGDNGAGADCVDRPGDILNINKYQAFPLQGQPAPVSSIAIKPYVYRYARIPAAQRPAATAENQTTPFDAATRPDLAFGAFQSNSASNNLCTVPTLSTATLTTSGGSVQADVDTKGVVTAYQFSNVQFLDDQTHGGQQMQADLSHTHGACVTTYKVNALYGLSFGTGGPTACLSQIDCSPVPDANDPNRLIPTLGSGINPDYPVFCDQTLGAYVGIGPLFLGVGASVGVCNLDGPFGTVCDHTSNPDCWKSGPQGSVGP